MSRKVHLWRYKDPALGPRLIPVSLATDMEINKLWNYCERMELHIKLSINLENKTIEFDSFVGSCKKPLGNTIIYTVE